MTSQPSENLEREVIRKTIRAYDSWIVRAYCQGRFFILRQRFLEEIGQYLPRTGRVLDLGCGFGLFSLYFAQRFPELRIHGLDLNRRRIALAHSAAERLDVRNVSYAVGDARTLEIDEAFDAVYMLDLVHHIPRARVRPLLEEIVSALGPSAYLLLKDVDSKPAFKRWFTWILDKLMDPSATVNYWHRAEICALLESLGFRVFHHAMVDYLPYPHMLYVCRKESRMPPAGADGALGATSR